MAQIWVLLDSVKAKYLEMSDYLKSNAMIVHSPVFKTAVIKVINGEALTAAVKKTLQSFEVGPMATPKRKYRENDYAARLLLAGTKKQRTGRSTDRYCKLLPLILPASSAVECLFSQCKLIMTPQRGCMVPANFEMLSFLRANMDLWDALTVASVEDEVRE